MEQPPDACAAQRAYSSGGKSLQDIDSPASGLGKNTAHQVHIHSLCQEEALTCVGSLPRPCHIPPMARPPQNPSLTPLVFQLAVLRVSMVSLVDSVQLTQLTLGKKACSQSAAPRAESFPCKPSDFVRMTVL